MQLVVGLMEMSGSQRVMVIDCQAAGISGDMMVAALLDLSTNPDEVLDVIRSIKEHVEGCNRIDVNFTEVSRSGFRAKQIKIEVTETVEHRSGSELIRIVAETARSLKLSIPAQDFAEKSIRTLVETEARLHRGSSEQVILHEAGSVDTIVDIIGSAKALDDLAAFNNTRVYATPVAVGGGLLHFSHGTVASPAPATLEILTRKGFVITGGPLDFELSTPTGVSILTTLAQKSLEHFPPMKPQIIGYGAGEKDYDDVPNILRIVVGQASTTEIPEDRVVLLETNLDDVTGETMGYAVERLASVGARDVSITPIFVKKSRPGWIISIVAEEKDVDSLTEILTLETGTLGVRVHPCHRKILMRENRKVELDISGAKVEVNVKIAKDRLGKITNLKPEYDDIRDLALKLKKPFREIHEEASQKAKKILGLK
jgi:uncharacterized protein (TIGR00299 family) protein